LRQPLLHIYAMAGMAAAPRAQGALNTPELEPALFEDALQAIQAESMAIFKRESRVCGGEKMRQLCLESPTRPQSPEMDFAARNQHEKAKMDAVIAQGNEKLKRTQ
jgi:hypothetical protein